MAKVGLRKRLLLVAGSAAFAVASMEVALRILTPPISFEPFPKYQVEGQLIPHPTRGYALNPGFTAKVQRGGREVEIEINGQGFVGPTVPTDEPVILAVGDSMTEGWGLDESESWPRVLSSELSARRGVPVPVLNAGVFGYGMREITATADALVREYRPRAIVAGLYVLGWDRVINPYVLRGGYVVRSRDATFLVVEDEGFFRSVFDTPGLQGLDAFLARYLRAGSFALRALASVFGATPPARPSLLQDLSREERRRQMQPFLAAIGELEAIADRAGVPFVALLMAIQDQTGRFDGEPGDLTLVRGQGAWFEVVLDYCAERGIEVVDTLPLLTEASGGEPIFMLRDDFHWSAAANALAAREIARVLGDR